MTSWTRLVIVISGRQGAAEQRLLPLSLLAPSISSNLFCREGSCLGWASHPPASPGQLTACQTGPGRMRWSVALERRKGLFCPLFCSACTPQTSNTTLDLAICGCSRVTLRWWVYYTEVLDNFVDQKHLVLNTSTTKEQVVDFKRSGTTSQPITIGEGDCTSIWEYQHGCCFQEGNIGQKLRSFVCSKI